MRTLHDPKTLAQQQGRDSPLNRGSVPVGGLPQPSTRSSKVSSPAAGTISDAPAQGQGQGQGRPFSFVGLSNRSFLTQLVGKLGQRTLLAGRSA